MYQCWQFSFFPSTLASIESSPRNWEMNLAFFHYKFSQLPIIFKWNDAPSLFDLAILAYFLSFFHKYTSYFFWKINFSLFCHQKQLDFFGQDWYVLIFLIYIYRRAYWFCSDKLSFFSILFQLLQYYIQFLITLGLRNDCAFSLSIMDCIYVLFCYSNEDRYIG